MAQQQSTIDVAKTPTNVDVAKASVIAYGNKDWNAVKAAVTPDVVYDEVATQRKVQGFDQVLAVWKGWGTAFPDSKAEFHSALVSGSTVVLELTWRGTHTGPLQMPTGQIAATGKRIEFRSCQIIEIAGGKSKSIRHYFDMATFLKQLEVTT